MASRFTEEMRAISAAEQYLSAGRWARHRHRNAYAAIVLEGGYLEAGDDGRWAVEPGDIVIHRAYSAHANTIEASRSVVLNCALPEAPRHSGVMRIRNTDDLVRAVRAGEQCIDELLEDAEWVAPLSLDWPDELAADLRHAPARIASWGRRHGLSPSTVARGFKAAYGTTPARYRLAQQVVAALSALRDRDLPLAEVASSHGFADQSHMSRSVRAITGRTPSRFRIRNSVQDGFGS